ncbi:hypothetical protein ACXYMP_15995 [Aliiroseovarius sp. CAU 1755]
MERYEQVLSELNVAFKVVNETPRLPSQLGMVDPQEVSLFNHVNWTVAGIEEYLLTSDVTSYLDQELFFKMVPHWLRIMLDTAIDGDGRAGNIWVLSFCSGCMTERLKDFLELATIDQLLSVKNAIQLYADISFHDPEKMQRTEFFAALAQTTA